MDVIFPHGHDVVSSQRYSYIACCKRLNVHDVSFFLSDSILNLALVVGNYVRLVQFLMYRIYAVLNTISIIYILHTVAHGGILCVAFNCIRNITSIESCTSCVSHIYVALAICAVHCLNIRCS